MRGILRYSRPIVFATLVAFVGVGTAFAQSSESSNYQVVETEFGASTREESCSGQYCATVSIGGDPSTGDSASAGSTATFGPITGIDPLLEVIVEQGESNLGDLSTLSPGTKTMLVKVRSYLSDGYVLQIAGEAPSNGVHSLNTLTTPTASDPGTEQFGLNLANNTNPDIGAAPAQFPDAQTSFGFADDDYSTPDLFMFSSGDEVARSETASGRTEYTVSIIVNISNTTPAGDYSGDFSAVVIPLF